MKKLLLLTVLLLIPILSFGQTSVVEKTHEITVSIDSNDVTTVYYYFPGSGGGTSGWTQTASNPKDKVYNTGDLTLIGKILLSSGTEASDSLEIYFKPIGSDGYLMGLETYYFDWTNNIITTTAPTGAALVKDWTLFSSSPTLGSSEYSFHMNFTGSIPPCHGLAIYIKMNDGYDAGISGTYAVTLQWCRGMGF